MQFSTAYSRTAATAAARASGSALKKEDDFDRAYALFNGPDRDYKNFPNPTQGVESPKTRLGFIPEGFFEAFYEKTGVTGPYIFGTGLIATLLSKEIWVVDHGFTEVIGFWIAASLVMKKFGPSIARYLDERNERHIQLRYINPMKEAKASSEQFVADAESAITAQEGQKYLFEAKRENVHLQLESTYRQRLHEVHQAVKKRLDYQLDVQNAKRSFEQKHMVNWIVDGVIKGITPQQEKEALNKCIGDLKALSQAHAASV